ncbi:MAG TPA: trypsin-like peptidase domain-containing protein, partial [Bradyrhizobium sp.]|nr:trypsin-like peptidase domain-containing protein [Bradyrhizobium sp.]
NPEIGRVLQSWLNISSIGDIISVGGDPVLINWGFLPKAIAADPSLQPAHFAQTLGRFAPSLGVPAAEPTAATAQAIPPAAASIPRGAPAPAPEPIRPTSFQPALPPPPLPPGPSRPWLAPLIASVIAAAVLLILMLPGVLVYPAASGRGERDAFEEQRLRASNDSLEAQLRTLQDTGRQRVCRLNDAPVPVPSFRTSPTDSTAKGPQEAPRMELLPRPPERVALPPNPDGANGANVGELLDNSTVLIIGFKDPDGISLGSGFFVSDRNVVTNHHVIAGVNEGNIFVASRAIGGIRRARLVVASQPPPSDDGDIRMDLAVLEIQPVGAHPSLRIGTTPPKLSTAYVAGFPGFITQRDNDFDTFITRLQESLRTGNVDEALSSQKVSVPSADLKYGRVNNVMSTGRNAVPIVIHDMQLARGNSGGPLVDACGRLGGINSLLFTSDQGAQQANVAQDVSLVRKFLTDNHIAFVSDESPCNPVVAKAPDAKAPDAKAPDRAPDKAPAGYGSQKPASRE